MPLPTKVSLWKRLGIQSFSDNGLAGGNVFSFFDTPPVIDGNIWYVDRISMLVSNEAEQLDAAITGVFLCPYGTPAASVLPGVPLSAAQQQQWLPIMLTEITDADVSQTKTTFLLGGIEQPIIVPEKWFLRTAIQNQGGVAMPAGSQVWLNLLMAQLEVCQ